MKKWKWTNSEARPPGKRVLQFCGCCVPNVCKCTISCAGRAQPAEHHRCFEAAVCQDAYRGHAEPTSRYHQPPRAHWETTAMDPAPNVSLISQEECQHFHPRIWPLPNKTLKLSPPPPRRDALEVGGVSPPSRAPSPCPGSDGKWQLRWHL